MLYILRVVYKDNSEKLFISSKEKDIEDCAKIVSRDDMYWFHSINEYKDDKIIEVRIK